MGFDGRSVVVTGGTGHLGATVVRRFLEAGAHVAVPVRDAGKGSELRDGLSGLAGTGTDARLFVAEAQAADLAAMERFVEAVMTRWGRVDALANLAGHFASGPAWDLDLLRQLWEDNFMSVATATATCLRPMRARGYGRIVSVSAYGSLRGGKETAAYAASKNAIVRWTESMAAALKDEGITVNAVLPSTIDHPDNRAAMPKVDPAKWVSPDELASLILFLVSEEASGVTGSAIPVLGRT
ncbi:MAG: SDR family NAD(P)-dependent oxidoreductase [Chloroflexi bacterium]|nr:SDR family NAD(P)-dependent oxidoreductase [Chloroflexota bacterium]